MSLQFSTILYDISLQRFTILCISLPFSTSLQVSTCLYNSLYFSKFLYKSPNHLQFFTCTILQTVFFNCLQFSVNFSRLQFATKSPTCLYNSPHFSTSLHFSTILCNLYNSLRVHVSTFPTFLYNSLHLSTSTSRIFRIVYNSLGFHPPILPQCPRFPHIFTTIL